MKVFAEESVVVEKGKPHDGGEWKKGKTKGEALRVGG